MGEFVVQRSYGRSIDFLMDWDAQYGTACAGLPLAMRFQDKAEAFDASQLNLSLPLSEGYLQPTRGTTMSVLIHTAYITLIIVFFYLGHRRGKRIGTLDESGRAYQREMKREDQEQIEKNRLLMKANVCEYCDPDYYDYAPMDAAMCGQCGTYAECYDTDLKELYRGLGIESGRFIGDHLVRVRNAHPYHPHSVRSWYRVGVCIKEALGIDPTEVLEKADRAAKNQDFEFWSSQSTERLAGRASDQSVGCAKEKNDIIAFLNEHRPEWSKDKQPTEH